MKLLGTMPFRFVKTATTMATAEALTQTASITQKFGGNWAD
ncbi:MAG: hypothetical protein ACYTXF_37210 [Nostoc sp.]